MESVRGSARPSEHVMSRMGKAQRRFRAVQICLRNWKHEERVSVEQTAKQRAEQPVLQTPL